MPVNFSQGASDCFMNDKIIFLKNERDRLRSEWKSLKGLKLSRKRELLLQEADIKDIRHDKLYRQYRKSQYNVSKKIRHIEIKINKSIASIKEKNGR